MIFAGHYKFNIQGRLLAIGTKENTITLTPQDTTIGWHGIRFCRTLATNDSSKIIYCNLQYVKAVGSSTDDKRGGAIFVRSFSKVLISRSLVTNNSTYGDKLTGGAGIFVDSCSPRIVNNSFSSNKAEGGHSKACPVPRGLRGLHARFPGELRALPARPNGGAGRGLRIVWRRPESATRMQVKSDAQPVAAGDALNARP